MTEKIPSIIPTPPNYTPDPPVESVSEETASPEALTPSGEAVKNLNDPILLANEKAPLNPALLEQYLLYSSAPRPRKNNNTLLIAGGIVVAAIIAMTILGFMLLGLAGSVLDPEDDPSVPTVTVSLQRNTSDTFLL